MKTNFTLLFTAVLFSFFSAQAQDCADLMISEVVEGWSNNKAIEIYNPTANAIDASEYGIVRFQNGNTVPSNVTYLVGAVIEPYDVYVVVLDKRDPDGTGFEAAVWDELQLQADVFVNPEYNDGEEVMYFNGNDALAILKDNGNTVVDVFGKIGEGTDFPGWGGYLDAAGEQAYVSQDHTLIRKENIVSGYTVPPTSFDILNEYDSLPANTFDMLGFHMCDCGVIGVTETNTKSTFKVFPNPSETGLTTIAANGIIDSYDIINVTGKKVSSQDELHSQSAFLDLTDLPQGTYFIKARLESGEEIVQVFLKK